MEARQAWVPVYLGRHAFLWAQQVLQSLRVCVSVCASMCAIVCVQLPPHRNLMATRETAQ